MTDLRFPRPSTVVELEHQATVIPTSLPFLRLPAYSVGFHDFGSTYASLLSLLPHLQVLRPVDSGLSHLISVKTFREWLLPAFYPSLGSTKCILYYTFNPIFLGQIYQLSINR